MKRLIKYCLFFISLNFAQTVTVPVELQINTIPKILSLSKKYSSAKINGKLAVIYSSESRQSIIFKNEVSNQLTSNEIKTHSKIWMVDYIDISKVINLEAYLKNNHIKIVYLAPLRGYNIKSFADVFNKLKILSFSSVPENINYSISVSFDVINENMKILIHRDSANQVNADFSSYLLKLALLK